MAGKASGEAAGAVDKGRRVSEVGRDVVVREGGGAVGVSPVAMRATGETFTSYSFLIKCLSNVYKGPGPRS